VRAALIALIVSLAMAGCAGDRLPPSPRERTRADELRAGERIDALVRGLPGVLDVRVLVVLPVDDPLAPAAPTPPRATVIAGSRAADPSPIRTAATTGARSLIGGDAEVTVVVVPAPTWSRSSRRLALAIAALALAAAATALALALARRRVLARYRGTRPQ
jgi:hypothetical protein